MNQQPVSTSNYLQLVILFLIIVATLGNSVVLMRCFSVLETIRVDYKLDREAIASRQREIVTILNSIELCVDAKPAPETQIK